MCSHVCLWFNTGSVSYWNYWRLRTKLQKSTNSPWRLVVCQLMSVASVETPTAIGYACTHILMRSIQITRAFMALQWRTGAYKKFIFGVSVEPSPACQVNTGRTEWCWHLFLACVSETVWRRKLKLSAQVGRGFSHNSSPLTAVPGLAPSSSRGWSNYCLLYSWSLKVELW